MEEKETVTETKQDDTITFSITLPIRLLQAFEQSRLYKLSLSRNDAIRTAIKAVLDAENKKG